MKRYDNEPKPLLLLQAVALLVRLCVCLGRWAFMVVAMVTPPWVKKLLCWVLLGGVTWMAFVVKPWRGW